MRSGPGSYLSICSKSGIEWVAAKTGVADFAQMAGRLNSTVSANLKLASGTGKNREPDPNEQTAWELTRLYFDEDPDAVFGIISRSHFENMLQAQYSKDGQVEALNDLGWYALRNLVFAAGSRLLLVKRSPKCSKESFLSSQSWGYFLNALSIHTDLMFCRSSLMAIQALTAMVSGWLHSPSLSHECANGFPSHAQSFYVEGIGCPALDYMLCSSAMKLAQSKGLHRRPAATWKLAPSVVASRGLLWWTIYTLERHNSCRSGRPLVCLLQADFFWYGRLLMSSRPSTTAKSLVSCPARFPRSIV